LSSANLIEVGIDIGTAFREVAFASPMGYRILKFLFGADYSAIGYLEFDNGAWTNPQLCANGLGECNLAPFGNSAFHTLNVRIHI
jgi:hypothetical protein